MSILDDSMAGIFKAVGIAKDTVSDVVQWGDEKLTNADMRMNRALDYADDYELTEARVPQLTDAERFEGWTPEEISAYKAREAKFASRDNNVVVGADGKPIIQQSTGQAAEGSNSLSEKQRLEDISNLDYKANKQSWTDWIPNLPYKGEEPSYLPAAPIRTGGGKIPMAGEYITDPEALMRQYGHLQTELSNRIQSKNRQLLGLSKN